MLEDDLVELIEPILTKYKDSIKKDKGIDYRNFAAHDIAKLVINHLFKLAKESPTGTFYFDSNTINTFCNALQ